MKKHSYDYRFKMKRQFEHVLKQDFNGASIGEVKRAINMALGPLPSADRKKRHVFCEAKKHDAFYGQLKWALAFK